MLFHITHRHSWETCPLNSDDPAGQVGDMKAVVEGNDQVTVLGSWMDAPAHKGYMIIEADNAAAIMTLCMPLVALGEMEVVQSVNSERSVTLHWRRYLGNSL